jgi:tRNA-(ms[2]io[6]A)-hydroxylase
VGLGLVASTPVAWVQRVEQDLLGLLSDHAHCELKAAASGQALVGKNPDFPRLVDEVSAVVVEEMEHFQLVVAELRRRGGNLGLQLPNHYADRLHAASGQGRTSILLDRLLVAHLIEGRSLERFQLLAEHLTDRDLAALYAGLVASEGRHRALFLSLARERFGDQADLRLEQLAAAEARILADLPPSPTMHSGYPAS